MNILLHGCNGKMGKVMTRLIEDCSDMKIVCGVDSNNHVSSNFPVYKSFDEVHEKADVLIDFSNHVCIKNILEFGIRNKLPLVICTTGFTEEEKKAMQDAAKVIPVFNSSNMSLGINLLISLAKKATEVLHENFDIEIVEKHHNQKVDSPSGTALMIADAVNSTLDNRMEYKYGRHSKTEKRQKNEIGIHSIRGGSIVGEHDVIFAGPDEVIEINHTAQSRDVFGYGAIKAARFIYGKGSGFYTMDDILKQM